MGLGGEAGFEIANSSSTNFSPQPYSVIVKALVQDNLTQELKLLVATSQAAQLFGRSCLGFWMSLGYPFKNALPIENYQKLREIAFFDWPSLVLSIEN